MSTGNRTDPAERLLRLNRDLGAALDGVDRLESALDIVLGVVLDLKQVDAAGFYLHESDNGSMRLIAQRGLSAAFAERVATRGPDSPSWEQLMAGRSHYQQTDDLEAGDVELRRDEGLTQSLTLPVIDRGRVFGCLVFATRSRDELPAPLRHSLESTAYLASHALGRILTLSQHRQSEDRLARLMDDSPDPVAVFDLKGRPVFLNPAFEKTFGWSPEELGDGRCGFVPPEYADQVRSALVGFRDGLPKTILETRRLARDGRVVDVSASASAFPDSSGQPAGLVVVFKDISERKKVERELRTRLRYEEALARTSRALLDGGDREGTLSDALEHLRRATEVGRAYLFELHRPDREPDYLRRTAVVCAPGVESLDKHPATVKAELTGDFGRWARRLEHGEPLAGRVEDLSADQAEFFSGLGIKSVLILPLSLAGEWHGFIGFDETETSRQWSETEVRLLGSAARMLEAYLIGRQTQQALADSERRFARFMDNLPALAFIKDTEGRYLYTNRAYDDIDVELGSRIGLTDAQIYPEEHAELNRKTDLVTLKRNEPVEFVYDVMRRTGLKTYLVSKFPITDPDREEEPLLGGVGLDITERRRAESTTRALLNLIPDMIFRFDRRGCYTFLKSPQVFEVEMDQSAVGRSMAELLPREVYRRRMELAGEVWAGRRVAEHLFSVEYKGRTAHREARYVSFSEDEVLAVVRDITERRNLESRLRQAEKMEAIGTLAGGIAHDFNNVLAAILGYSELSLSRGGLPEVIRSNLEQVVQASLRAKDLVHQILSFSRPSEPEQRQVAIGPLVKETLKMLRSTLPSTVELRQEVDPAASPVQADTTQIHQLLMNLCSNASHAMVDGRGVLTVAVEDIRLTRAREGTAGRLEPGRYCRLSVTDTGSGMSPEVVGRIFEPYFTTKDRGRGTGMGLAVVHGIVQGHGGLIEVDSLPGRGSTFRIWLPAVEAEAQPEEERILTGPSAGLETVLFIDDEELLVDIGRQSLNQWGYRVVGRTDSVQALRDFTARPHRFDLVVTDQTMPNLTGLEVAREMHKIRPELPVILCTGHSEMVRPDHPEGLGVDLVMLKPVTPDQLAAAVRRVLDENLTSGTSPGEPDAD